MLEPNLNEQFSLENIFSSKNNWKYFATSEIINDSKTVLTQKLDEFKGGKGTYIFWWTGTLEALNELNRKILLQGKKAKETYEWHAIEMQTSWLVPIEIEGQKRYALYVGKSTTLRNRIRQHFHFSLEHDSWLGSINKPIDKNDNSYFNLTGFKKRFDQGYKKFHNPTTSCQFRSGMTLLCRDKTEEQLWKIIEENISLSILEIEENENHLGTVTRFYLEDYLIGALRPWFNLDSER